MALPSSPFGFRPAYHMSGGVIRHSTRYRIASGLASNIFRGDIVKSTGTTNQITPAAATNTILGVFNGCTYTTSDGRLVYSKYWPTGTTLASGTECIAEVFDDPNLVFQVMMTTAAATDNASFVDLNAGAGGSTSTGISGEYVDTPGTGVTFKLMGFNVLPMLNSTGGYEMNALGSNTIVEVRPVKHELAGTGYGVNV